MKYLLTLLVLTALDLGTKYWALQQLHTPWIFTSFFQFTFSTNCGIAFGFFSSCTMNGQILLATSALMICIYLIKHHTHSTCSSMASTMIISGAIGNVISRVLHQAVIDFISLHYQSYYWPTFNLADIFICLGTLTLLLCQKIKN